MTAQTKPDWLIERKLSFDDGSSVVWNYDTDGDLLEVIFAPGIADATVEIAQGVLFRIGLTPGRALNLSFVSASPLLKPGAFGPNLLSLNGLADLDSSLRDTALQLLVSPPVSHVLGVFSYRPSPEAEAAVPLATLQNAA